MRTTILFVTGILISLFVYAASFYKVEPGYVQIAVEHSSCRWFQNTGTKSILVPSNTSAEWNAVYSKPPAEMAVGTTTDAESQECCSKACYYAY